MTNDANANEINMTQTDVTTGSEPTQTVHDPVCHMEIDIKTAAGRSDHDGLTYYFCSEGCKASFDADPEGVLKAEEAFNHDQPAGMGMNSGAQR